MRVQENEAEKQEGPRMRMLYQGSHKEIASSTVQFTQECLTCVSELSPGGKKGDNFIHGLCLPWLDIIFMVLTFPPVVISVAHSLEPLQSVGKLRMEGRRPTLLAEIRHYLLCLCDIGLTQLRDGWANPDEAKWC